MEIKRPTELVGHLIVIASCAPDEYLYEDWLAPDQQPTNATFFRDAFEALDRFTETAKTEEGKERLRECKRNLQVAFELYEHSDNARAANLVFETEGMFQRCRKYIPISDE